MRLGEMSFKDSRNAQMLIAPLAERIMSDPQTAAIFDKALGVDYAKPYAQMTDAEKIDMVKRRVAASKELTDKLIYDHFGEICEIFAILNNTSVKEVEEMRRADANIAFHEMLSDGDIQSFFMSSGALAQAAQSVILPSASPSRPKPQSSTSKKNTSTK